MSLRISTAGLQMQGLQALLQRQTQLARTQQQMTTGLRFSHAAEDPSAAAQAQTLDHAVAALDQFGRNADQLESRLHLQEQALADAGDQLQRARELAIQANNGTLSQADRSMLATEVRQLRSGLLAIANRDDGNGRSLFAGSQSHVVPFSDSAGRVSYAGDDGQNLVDVAPDQALADTNAGSDVFLRVRSGDGDIRGRALPGNTGGGVLQGTAVTDHASWNGRTLRLEFTAPDSWRVLDAGGATIGSGSYAPGDSIDAGGVQVRLSGTPASGDAFMLEPAPNQDIFSTLQSLADALVAPAGTPVDQARLNNAMGSAITDLDTAQNHLSMVRADTGARLSALADGADTRAAQDESLRSSLSQLRDVDYAQAASQLSLQMTALDAAQRTLLKVQSLSLFDQL